MKSIKMIIFLMIFLLIVVGVNFCSFANEKNTLVVTSGTDVQTLDPHQAGDNNTEDMILAIYEGLVGRGENGEIIPILATGWEVSEDGKTWTFKLREGVKFHDNTLFNAAAVKSNIERLLDPKKASPHAGSFSFIKEVEVVNEYEVKIICEAPFGAMLDLLTIANITMMSPTAFQKYNEDYSLHAAGTGALMLDQWERGIKFILKRFDDYWGEKPAYEKLEYKTVPEDSTRMMMLKVGETDIIKGVSPLYVDELRKDENIVVVMKPGPRVIYIGMNQAFEPFNDIRVRRAIQYAVDKDSIVKNILKGYVNPAIGTASPVITHAARWLPNIYEYNPEKAKKLLAEAGYEKGFKTTIFTPEGRYPADRMVAEIVQGQLKEIGIDAQLKVLEWGAYSAAFTKKEETRLFLLGSGNPPLDLDYFYQGTFRSGVMRNYLGYSNPEVDRLLDLQRETVDFIKRGQILFEIQRILQEDAVWLNLFYVNHTFATRANVKGLSIRPNESVIYKGVYFE